MAQGIESEMGTRTDHLLRGEIRGMHGHLWAGTGPLEKTPDDRDEGGLLLGDSGLPEMPRDLRPEDDPCRNGECRNEDHFVKGRHITCDRVANAIFLKAIIANKALATPLENYYREALEWYEDVAGLNEPGKFHQ
jgi:hypothetical protein